MTPTPPFLGAVSRNQWMAPTYAVTIIALGALLSAARVVQAQLPCHGDSGRTTCRIDQPTVKQRVTPYRSVVFKPGDTVTVSAGGCVQTGGAGLTWKRYVNPSGQTSERLYHGLINIPGNPAGDTLVRIAAISNKKLVIPGNVTKGHDFLTLGYEDDDYADNGYYQHDDGTEGQCKQGAGKDGGPAWVVLEIRHPKQP